MNDKVEFIQEQNKLAKTINTMEQEIILSEEAVVRLRDDMKKFNPITDNPGLLMAMEHSEVIYLKKIHDYKHNMPAPYFASIDVLFDDLNDKSRRYYIGKCNVSANNGTEIEVVDWRAPVSSLYYDGRVGRVSYEAPAGIIDCMLNNKRMYTIEDRQLLSFLDVDVAANDELLKPYLDASSDNRLKNIIATIQAEQNKVIRANMKKPLIVQGVAGSGKTTSALHRIAFLVYLNSETLSPADFVIIAPNKLFLDYISEVLPDLGVENVKQITFEDLANMYLQCSYTLKSPNQILIDSIESNTKQVELLQKIANVKSSLEYKDAVEKFIADIKYFSLPEGDIKIAGITVIEEEILRKLYDESMSDRLSIDENFKKFLEQLSRYVSDNYGKICRTITDVRDQKLSELKALNLPEAEFRKQKIKLYDEYDYLDLMKSSGKKLIAQYSKKRKKRNALQYYSLFIEQIEKYLAEDKARMGSNIRKEYKKNKTAIDIEDLPAIMYIQKSIDGKNEKDLAKHIVVDEAQDYTPFQLFVLKEILQSESLTILGDIAQGIYSYRGINDWDYINEKIFNSKADVVILDKSYRTTVEIMNEANKVIKNVDSQDKFIKAVPVIRNGEAVNIKQVHDFKEMIDNIAKRVQQLVETRKNIAIITKSFKEAQTVCDELNKVTGMNVQIISENNKEYAGGIVVIPSYMSKGLEFDSVIIADASDKKFLKNEIDAKLLYVSLTRAMHTLDVFYIEQLTELMK